MTRLKLGPLVDDKPVRITIELPASTHRALVAYADALASETGQTAEPAKLIAPMIERFMLTDRASAKARRTAATAGEHRSENAYALDCRSSEQPEGDAMGRGARLFIAIGGVPNAGGCRTGTPPKTGFPS